MKKKTLKPKPPVVASREMKQIEASPNEKLLRELISELTTYHDDIEIKTEYLEERGKKIELLRLRVHSDDQPKVIGRGGRVVSGLGRIFEVAGLQSHKPCRLLLLEPNVGQQQEYGEDGHREYKPDELRSLAERVLGRLFLSPFDLALYGADTTEMMEVSVSKKDKELAEFLEPYLRAVFNAIGRNKGRDLYFEIKTRVPIPTPESNS